MLPVNPVFRVAKCGMLQPIHDHKVDLTLSYNPTTEPVVVTWVIGAMIRARQLLEGLFREIWTSIITNDQLMVEEKVEMEDPYT